MAALSVSCWLTLIVLGARRPLVEGFHASPGPKPLLHITPQSSGERTREQVLGSDHRVRRPDIVIRPALPFFSFSSQPDPDSDDDKPKNKVNRRRRVRKRVTEMAKKMVLKPISYAYPMPQAIAAVLRDATLGAVDMAVDEVIQRTGNGTLPIGHSLDVSTVIDEVFLPIEQTLEEMEESLRKARGSLQEAKAQASDAMEAVQAAAIAQVEGAAAAVAMAEETAGRQAIAEVYAAANDIDVDALSFEDVDYGTSEMAPPFLDSASCLVPGEPVIRVEKARENSRRIFAGVDIMASVDTVWDLLTDYEHLQKVVPNLVVNDVLELYEPTPYDEIVLDTSQPEERKCKEIADHMKGSKLRQVGGAKVAGINFSARTTLEVREWPQGLPDFAHFNDEVWEGKTRKQRAKEYSKVKLERYRFPRPFAVSALPTRDITMQSVEDDGGEFRLYQGVWRMQPLPGCAPPGQQAMRLTYAVEVSPRAYLPVQLIEGRIARDLCTNLEAIRDYVAKGVTEPHSVA